MNVPIEISARHLHLSQEHMEILFGAGYALTPRRELSQKGYFVTQEKVEVIGEKASALFSILIPLRKKTQVEMAVTDAKRLGVVPVLRISGHLEGSSPVKLKGPMGEINLTEGAIIAKRHIHMSSSQALNMGFFDGDEVLVKVENERGGILDHVVITTSPTFNLTMHIDTDEGNAFGIGSAQGTIIKK